MKRSLVCCAVVVMILAAPVEHPDAASNSPTEEADSRGEDGDYLVGS